MTVARAVAAGMSALCLSAQVQQPVFRSSADGVFVDVSVLANRKTVPGLTAADFSLTDNGVSQVIDAVTLARDPIDLQLLVETGGELRTLVPAILKDTAMVKSLLQPGDRAGLVTFDSQVRTGASLDTVVERGENGTILFDAITAALMQREEPGRRRVIVVVTAGIDTHSLLDRATRRRILERSQPPVHLIALGRRPIAVAMGLSTGPDGQARTDSAMRIADYGATLSEVADVSGGRLFALDGKGSFLGPLRQALDEFRTRYVLHYRPAGVDAAGWHALAVTVTRQGRYDVRARRGYWRD
jgi:VWFA-related protein